MDDKRAVGERRQDQQVQKRRGQQPAKHGDRHWPFDFLSRAVQTESQRGEAERSNRRRHENRHQPLIRAAHHQIDIPVRALHFHEVFVVRKLQDRVARADAEHRDQTDDGAERDAQSGRRDCQDAADQAKDGL